jgi:hypothetical protein
MKKNDYLNKNLPLWNYHHPAPKKAKDCFFDFIKPKILELTKQQYLKG